MTNVGVIKAKPGSELMQYCYETARDKDIDTLVWGETGPKLFTAAVKKFKLESFVRPPELYNPVDFWEWYRFIDGNVDETVLSGAYSVHLWNEMWRRNGVDKDARFPENSPYEILKRRYLERREIEDNRPIYRWQDKSKPAFSLTPEEIDTIRDTAVAVESLNPELAYRLMSIAHRARPTADSSCANCRNTGNVWAIEYLLAVLSTKPLRNFFWL